MTSSAKQCPKPSRLEQRFDETGEHGELKGASKRPGTQGFFQKKVSKTVVLLVIFRQKRAILLVPCLEMTKPAYCSSLFFEGFLVGLDVHWGTVEVLSLFSILRVFEEYLGKSKS